MATCLTLAASPVASLLAQDRMPAPVEFAVEQRVRDRWMHGRQQPRFTRFAQSRTWLFGDSLRTAAGGVRRLFLTLGRTPEGRDSALIEVDATGRVVRLAASLRPPSRAAMLLPDDSARYARMRLFSGDGRLTLPESRLWDLVPTFHPAAGRPGMRWTDTLARAATHDGYRQTLRGVRVSTLLGDTTIGGRRLWVVRDSARVRYEERWLEEERTLGSLVTATRITDGVIRGRHVYDPELGLFRARADTTLLSGEAVLRYPDDYPGLRTFRTPARYERYRDWDVYDGAGYTTRQAALRATADREHGGMVDVPGTDVERRLAGGDSVARDSLLAEWQRSDDPERYESLFRLLQRWGARDRGFYAQLDSLRIARGDTTYLYSWLARRAYSPRQPADTAAVRSMLRFMRDPGLPFAFNESRDWLYENLRQGLTSLPPAVTRDTSKWSCTPAACRLLAEQWRAAREPRLREVGLVARLALEPARWADTVLARAAARSPFLDPAVMLVRGVGATWPAASKAPMPGPNADWQTWLEWLSGEDPRYAAARAAAYASARLPKPRPEPRVRFEDSHTTAIRFFQARTGRDVVAELRRGLETAASDSARLVFGTMLQGLGELRLSADEVAAHLRSGEPGRIALARRALIQMFWFEGQAKAADSATALPLLDRLVALVVDGAPPWRSLDGQPGPGRRGPELHAAPTRQSVFLLADSTPAALRDKWRDRVGIVTAAEWRDRPLTEAGVLYTLSSVRRVGPFVLLTVNVSERTARRQGEAPRLYAAETQFYLMELGSEWVIVALDAWVT